MRAWHMVIHLELLHSLGAVPLEWIRSGSAWCASPAALFFLERMWLPQHDREPRCTHPPPLAFEREKPLPGLFTRMYSIQTVADSVYVQQVPWRRCFDRPRL
jgi:hypothetical protein